MTATAPEVGNIEQIEAEERAELAALGIVADVKPTTQAERDAQASILLRRLMFVRAEFDERTDAMNQELLLVRTIYQKHFDQLARRAMFLENAVKTLALEADFGPKAKSRQVGFGRYGIRQKPQHVTVTDIDALHQAIEQEHPAAMVLDVKAPLDFLKTFHPRLYEETQRPESELLAIGVHVSRIVPGRELHRLVKDGVDIPGIHIEPATDLPYAEPVAFTPEDLHGKGQQSPEGSNVVP